jgi:predicted amidohydrolase YtcJ
LAIRGDRIVAVGTDSDVMTFKGPQTQLVDLGGHFVMPGFNDAHLHLASAGSELLEVNLKGVKSLAEFRERIRAKVQESAPGTWVVGDGWDETLWPVPTLPSRWDLDEVTTDHPVFLYRVDGHMAVANSRALQLASITVASKDPQGGAIDHDSTGQPTGILRDTAWVSVASVVPLPTPERRRQALELALQDLARWGITSAQDYSYWDDFQALERIEQDGKLTAHVSEWLDFNDPLDTLKAHRASHPQSDLMLHTGMLKGFMDGSVGSHTAALIQPYSDQPNNSGLPRYDQETLNAMTKERVEAGFQIGFHAIGDRGVQMALDAFAEAGKDAAEKKIKAANGGTNYRLRIEHAQVTNLAQIAEFKNLHVVASMQPSQLLTDMNWVQDRIGPKRAATAYAWLRFLDKGVILAFGTDYPIEAINPFRGLYSAVTRKSEDGKREYFPDQHLTIEQAITAYTIGSAIAEFEETEKGTLAVGKLADLVVLDRDITAVNPPDILGTKVLRTVVGGRTVYAAEK